MFQLQTSTDLVSWEFLERLRGFCRFIVEQRVNSSEYRTIKLARTNGAGQPRGRAVTHISSILLPSHLLLSIPPNQTQLAAAASRATNYSNSGQLAKMKEAKQRVQLQILAPSAQASLSSTSIIHTPVDKVVLRNDKHRRSSLDMSSSLPGCGWRGGGGVEGPGPR